MRPLYEADTRTAVLSLSCKTSCECCPLMFSGEFYVSCKLGTIDYDIRISPLLMDVVLVYDTPVHFITH